MSERISLCAYGQLERRGEESWEMMESTSTHILMLESVVNGLYAVILS